MDLLEWFRTVAQSAGEVCIDLRRHVVQCAGAGEGQLLRRHDREAQVAQLQLPLAREEQVLRLDVAVHNPVDVQAHQHLQQRRHHLQGGRLVGFSVPHACAVRSEQGVPVCGSGLLSNLSLGYNDVAQLA